MHFLHEITLVEKDATVMVLADTVDKDSVESVPQATAVRMPDSQPTEPQRNSLFAP